jgi:hypothetical protein
MATVLHEKHRRPRETNSKQRGDTTRELLHVKVKATEARKRKGASQQHRARQCQSEQATPTTSKHDNKYCKATPPATGAATQQQKQTTSSNTTAAEQTPQTTSYPHANPATHVAATDTNNNETQQ